MNIKQAKEEVKNTFLAYTWKEEMGEYKIPSIRQRPLLLMGPPGIGKTAVVAQAAQELKTNFVSYTMTHHTRQSAVGLPLIREKELGGRTYSITEYTMSEIIGSVYEQIEKTGQQEGILFLDEINCVSETLAPTMLQFLQCKKFGTHSLPKGWMIVAAGNPPQYNKSVRDFDLVTLDRVKLMNVSEDYVVWREYAVGLVHSVILSYLDLKKDAFYQIERRPNGMAFITARGWEDLSTVLSVYEELGIEITEEFLLEYIQIPEIATDFKNYYDLYQKYKDYYHIGEIIKGNYNKEQVERLRNAPFDEAVSVISLFLARLQESFERTFLEDQITKELHNLLTSWKTRIITEKTGEEARKSFQELLQVLEKKKKQIEKETIDFQDSSEKEILACMWNICRNYETMILQTGNLADMTAQECFSHIKLQFSEQVEKRNRIISEVKAELDNSFEFLEKVFHSSQEMVIFITELSSRKKAVQFIMENGCDKFYQYNEDLLFYEKQKVFQAEISELKEKMKFL